MYILTLQLADRLSVNSNVAALDLIKTHQQINQRAFPCSSRSDNGDLLAGGCYCGKIVNYGLV
ncbi:hypothetical protein D3C75_860630 [compost metagenome]